MKLTAKQELFCRELAKGKTQYESFCIAYPLQAKNSKRESLDCNASQLANSTKIMQRVAKLQEKALTHVKYDIEAHFKELDLAKELAMTPMGKDGNIDIKALIKAVELKGKVKGHYVTKTEVTNKDDMTDEQALIKLREHAEKLGLTFEEYSERMGLK